MRVIAGVAKGRPLLSPRGRRVRPTSDRVRQSLMDILAARTPGRAWLDLYAGSGSVGIEALSRGAGPVVFVERDPQACRALLANLQRTGLARGAEVRQQSVERALAELAAQGRRFDVIFADPPYGQGEVEATLARVAAAGVLQGDGLLVIQHSSRERPEPGGAWTVVREVRFGETQLTILAPQGREAAP